MSSTLIVRDATLAINGAPETRGDLDQHLRHRLVEATRLDLQTVEECIEILLSAATGEDADIEVLEALTIVGLSHAELASRLEISPVAMGRRLAARFERMGQPEDAMTVLEFLVERHQGHRALERDLAALMRRQGMVKDLVDRYLVRAQKLLKEGKTVEAINWLREVLLLDRSRKDVARMIRDLRFQEVAEEKNKKAIWRVALVVLLLSLGASALFLREKRLREEFLALPAAEDGDLGAMKARLSQLEPFLEKNSVWHGSLFALEERSRLRVEIERLEAEQEVEAEETAAEMLRRKEAADFARATALDQADSGDFEEALAEFRRALEIAPPDWEHHHRVERDIESISAFLEDAR